MQDRSEGWFSMNLTREIVGRARADWRARPVAARRGWWRTFLVGTAASVVLILALVWLAMRLEASGALAWEPAFMSALDAPDFPLRFSTAIWMETMGNGVYLVPVLFGIAFVSAWVGQPLIGLTLLAAYFLLDIPIVTGWLVWDRPRPDLIAGGISDPGGLFSSYPSGHTAHAVAVYGFFGYLWARHSRSWTERAFAILLMSTVVCVVALARLRLGAHWPSDVVAGLILGGAWLGAVVIPAYCCVERGA